MSDTLQNRPVQVSTAIRTAYPLELDSSAESVNLIDVMAQALSTYGIYVDTRLDMRTKKITVQVLPPPAAVTLEADKALTEGVKSLLRGQIIDLGLHYIKEGDIPPYRLDNLENYYTAYVDLGDGDRSTHDIMDRCRKLPIRSGGE